VRNWHRLFRDIVEGAHHEALVRHVGHRPIAPASSPISPS
jgi:hypothetical protein